MIKQGTIKLSVDIFDFLLEDNTSMLTTKNEEDEDGQQPLFKNLIFPFIKYIEGSYFGDNDILVPGLRFFERDSTATASVECQFFVLQREFLMRLRRTFGREILQMEEQAKRRKFNHKNLIQTLGKKAQMIMKEKPDKVKIEREFFEINLMNMEEFDMADLGIADDKDQSPDNDYQKPEQFNKANQ